MGLIEKLSAVLLILIFILDPLPGIATGKIAIEKSAPKGIDVGAKGMVVLEITANQSVSSLDIVESIPLSLSFEEWSISGYDPAMVAFEERIDGSLMKRRWAFRQGFSPGERSTLTYFFSSQTEGEFNLSTLYIYPSSFERVESIVKVSENRPLVFVFVLGSLILLLSLYLTHRSKKGERKLFSFVGKLLKKKKQME